MSSTSTLRAALRVVVTPGVDKGRSQRALTTISEVSAGMTDAERCDALRFMTAAFVQNWTAVAS